MYSVESIQEILKEGFIPSLYYPNPAFVGFASNFYSIFQQSVHCCACNAHAMGVPVEKLEDLVCRVIRMAYNPKEQTLFV